MSDYCNRVCARCGYEIDIEESCHRWGEQFVCNACADKEVADLHAENERLRELLERADRVLAEHLDWVTLVYGIEVAPLISDIRAALATVAKMETVDGKEEQV